MSPPNAWAVPGAASATSTAVADTPELRAAYNASLPKVTEFWTRLGADERLYAKYKAMDPGRSSLNAEQRQARAMRCAILCWAARNCRARRVQRFAAIQERQAELSQKFSENALDATDKFAYYASADELAGMYPPMCWRPPAPRRRREGQGRLPADAEDALLPAGDAVRRQQRAARDALPRLRHPRLRPGPEDLRASSTIRR
jgi:oligopeptidase A